MAVKYKGKTEQGVSTSTTNINQPAVTAVGDLLILVATSASLTSFTGTGWTAIRSDTAPNAKTFVLWKYATVAGSSGHAISATGGTLMTLALHVYTGTATSNPIQDHSLTTSTVQLGTVAASVAGTAGGRLLTIFNMAQAASSTIAWTPPAGATERTDYNWFNGSQTTIEINDEPLAATGATASRTGTPTNAGNTTQTSAYQITILPAPAGAPFLVAENYVQNIAPALLPGGGAAEAGDLLVFTIASSEDDDPGWTTPAGWTRGASATTGGVSSNGRHYVTSFWKILTAGEAMPTFTYSQTGLGMSFYVTGHLYSGANASAPVTFSGAVASYANGVLSVTLNAPAATVTKTSTTDVLVGTLRSSSGSMQRTRPNLTGNYSASAGLALATRAATGAAPTDATTASDPTYSDTGLSIYRLLIAPENRPPSAPVVTSPNGGEVIGNSTTVTWTAGADPDADALVYDLDYSADNGATWAAMASGVAGTSYAWNTAARPAGAAYLVRIRSRDPAGLVSAYDQSNAVFTIQHNVAPTAATGLTPDGGVTVDRNAVQRLAWTFQDADPGDTQSKFDLRWRVGVGAWTTVTQTTPSPYYDAPAATFPAGSVEWQVLTYDAQGVVATAWSASAFFTAATAPGAPVVTAPANNATQGAPTGVISWSAPAQDAYQVRKVADNAGAANTSVIYYDTGTVVSSTARNAALDFPTNNRTEHLQVRIRSAGLWSTWASVKVNVAWSPPAVPVVAVTARPELAAIDVAVANPAPTGTQPAVASTELWRRRVGATETLRLAAVVVGGTYRDATPASGVAYEYQAVAIGTTGTKQASAWTP